MITVKDSAQTYFLKLIRQQGMERPGLRLWVDRPGTPAAECQLAFCEQGDQEGDDQRLGLKDFVLYVDAHSAPYLDEAVMVFEPDETGGRLSIKAPNLKGREPGPDAPLTERVAWVLDAEVNPMVARHGGLVALEEVTDDGTVVLRFGGGCHGCGMVDVTLKQGIEKIFRKRLPEIAGIRDATDHATGTNPYY